MNQDLQLPLELRWVGGRVSPQAETQRKGSALPRCHLQSQAADGRRAEGLLLGLCYSYSH